MTIDRYDPRAAQSPSRCPIAESAMRPFDPFSARYQESPYSVFTELRSDAPVCYSQELDHWVVSRYDDIKRILSDPASFSAEIALSPVQAFSEEVQRILSEGGYRSLAVMANLDPPMHTRVRRSVNLAFTPRRIAALEPFIRRVVHEHVDRFAGRPRVDLVHALHYDLPALVIFRLLGVPDEDVGLVKAGAKNRLLLIWGRPTPDEQAAVARGFVSFWQYCERLVEQRLAKPGDDLTSDLLATRNGDDSVLSLQEIVSVIFGLLFAGHETTTAFLSNAVLQLLQRDGLRTVLAERPDLIPNAVEELLRIDTSVIAWRRIANRAVDVAGVEIPAGARVLLLLGAANRDEARFPDPDELRLDRANAREHLSFGFGIHYCLGAALARLEALVVLEVLAARFPAMRLVSGRAEFIPNLTFRGPERLLVETGV